MKKGILWIIVALAIIVVVIVVSQKSAQTNSQTIKIGALLSLTGDAAAWGENAQRAIRLAVDEVNEKGSINGKKIEMLYEDTGGDPKKAVSAYQLMTSVNHVTAVIGPLGQTEDMSVMPLIQKTETPTIVPGYIPLKNRNNSANPFLVWMDAELEAGRIAQHVYDQGIRTVGVIGTLDSWESTVSNSFVEKFKSLGGTITALEIVQPTEADMKLPATRVISSKPQAIFLGTYYQFINSTKSLSDLKYSGKLFSIEVDDYLAGETAKWSDKLEFVAPDYYNEAFVSKFKKAYNAAPGLPAGQAYDATNILFSFLQHSETKKGIIEQMKGFTSYDGVSGKLEIGPDGRTYLPMALFQVNKGSIVRLSALE